MSKRRVYGPDSPRIPLSVTPSHNKTQKHSQSTLRPIYCKLGLLSRALGSAFIETGNSKVVAAVHLSPRNNPFSCDFKFAPFSGGNRRGYVKVSLLTQDGRESDYSLILEQALAPAIILDRYPTMQIGVHVMVLENDGPSACLAAAVSCASLALVNAGIEMYDSVTASSCVYLDSLYLDPTASLEESSKASMVLCYMPSLNQITHIIQTGTIPVHESVEAIELLVDSCHQSYSVLRQAMIDSLQTNDKQDDNDQAMH